LLSFYRAESGVPTAHFYRRYCGMSTGLDIIAAMKAGKQGLR
jgi:hypothetical protein